MIGDANCLQIHWNRDIDYTLMRDIRRKFQLMILFISENLFKPILFIILV